MTELSFAKSFLIALDTKPTKLSADYVEDPRNLPARSAQILPKMSRPLVKRQKLAPGQERSINVTLKSLRNPPLDITLSSQLPNTSILDLKTGVSEQASIPVDKLRILYKKKPVGDSKVLKDVVGEEETAVEFSIMVMGGAASVTKLDQEMSADTKAPITQGQSGKEVLGTEEFWSDLQGFLTQRLRDEDQATEAFGVFRRAWDSHGSAP